MGVRDASVVHLYEERKIRMDRYWKEISSLHWLQSKGKLSAADENKLKALEEKYMRLTSVIESM